jgi:cytochrome c-type biogenesis protein CcmE
MNSQGYTEKPVSEKEKRKTQAQIQVTKKQEELKITYFSILPDSSLYE